MFLLLCVPAGPEGLQLQRPAGETQHPHQQRGAHRGEPAVSPAPSPHGYLPWRKQLWPLTSLSAGDEAWRCGWWREETTTRRWYDGPTPSSPPEVRRPPLLAAATWWRTRAQLMSNKHLLSAFIAALISYRLYWSLQFVDGVLLTPGG